MSYDPVRVRTIRPHDTTEGLKVPGDEYDRTKEEADTLSAQGIVRIVKTTAPAKSKAKAKASKRK